MRNLQFFLMLVFCCSFYLVKGQSGSTGLPNIILILADDLGYNDLSCYRNLHSERNENTPTCLTPNIDALAKTAMLFTDFYSGAAVCSPSRSALLTGRNKTRLGIYNWIPENNPMHLRNEEVTIAELLKQKNYATAHFGKWHLTSANMLQPEPLDQGYDFAFWTHNNAIPSHENPENFIRNRDKVGELEGYSCQIVIDESINWLKKRKNESNPFYMNIWFHESHSKEAAPDSLKNRHKRNQAYYGCIENMDNAVGKLMKFLNESGMDTNTIVLFTSDNGSQYQGSNDPLRGEKCFQYEGGIRVPFIAFWRGKILPGINSRVNGHFIDVLPTIANITGCRLPQNKIIDGENLSDVLLGNGVDFKRNKPLFFYRYFHDPVCMVREGDFVLLGYVNKPKPYLKDYNVREEALFKPAPDEPSWAQWSFQEKHMEALKKQEPIFFELYNLSTDIEEKKDLSESNTERVEKMKKIMFETRKTMIQEGGDWYK